MGILLLFSVFICFECRAFLEECGDGIEENSPVSALEDGAKASPHTISEDMANGRSR